MKKENKLYSIDDAQSLSTSEVHNLYRKYVNAARVDLLSAFDFGNELVSHSEASIFIQKMVKKYLILLVVLEF